MNNENETPDEQNEPTEPIPVQKKITPEQIRKGLIIGGAILLAGIAVTVIARQQTAINSLASVADIQNEVLDVLVDVATD